MGDKYCMLCPRECGTNRKKSAGFCGAKDTITAARAALHFYEEPCISGNNGSGTVFFSGCPLHCCFCQNHTISSGHVGKELSIARLAEIFLQLQEKGAHNINLVSPTQFVPQIVEALQIAKPQLCIPVVYNTGGYEKVETLKQLDGLVDIYLPDLKYYSTALSARYSHAPDYFSIASKAILEMYRQTGPINMGKDGMLERGVIIRHLVLPGARKDSLSVLQWIARSFIKDTVWLSLMRQYTPYQKLPFPELNRRVTTFEYNCVKEEAQRLELVGYQQEKSAAKAEYTPSFDLTGI